MNGLKSRRCKLYHHQLQQVNLKKILIFFFSLDVFSFCAHCSLENMTGVEKTNLQA